MDPHLPTFLRIQLLQHRVDVPHRVVLATVVIPHNAQDPYGLLVHLRPHSVCCDGECILRRDDKLGLDVHIPEELLPRRLEACGED